jgi:hypothetical protein
MSSGDVAGSVASARLVSLTQPARLGSPLVPQDATHPYPLLEGLKHVACEFAITLDGRVHPPVAP